MTETPATPPPPPPQQPQQPQQPGPRRRSAGGTILAIALIAAGVIAAFVINHKRQVSADYVQDPNAPPPAEPVPTSAADLPVRSEVANFSFTDQAGKAVTLETLKGRVWVADLFFTNCGTVCPTMTRMMEKLHREFTGKDEPKFVSINVDPPRDTPEAIQDYARMHQADTERWWFVTGDQKQVQEVATSMQLPYRAGDPGSHSNRFVLIDRDGKLRGSYIGMFGPEIDKLRRDLKLLLAAPKN